MNNKSQIYWYCQVVGWTFYIVVNSIFFGLSSQSGYKEYIIYFLMLPIGIAITHFYRHLIVRLRLFTSMIPRQLFYIILFSLIKGLIFFLVVLALSRLFGLALAELTLIDIFESVINFAVIFCLWNFIYFGFRYFQNYKQSEINALKYLAANRESELNNLKAQLNPHFIFNCMNSIRALIDENPPSAKSAVTRLSNILRYTLQFDKNKEITFKNEMELVKDFLELEKVRYEERLTYSFNISPGISEILIPPFIIQSQVENAIKHGISSLPGNGIVTVDAGKYGDNLVVKVSNTGRLTGREPLTGVGFKNSTQRLRLLYGEEARISITESGSLVVVEINIPLKK